jgi:crotonobetainyl-CoA:carnitine CoA-transferase CaiB-like acyl-CoA transferase
LRGIKVLDLTRVLAGPYCTMLLADLGADVLKIESPAGDETRRWGPPFHRGTAAYFFGANRNKWGVVVDLTTDDGRATLGGLVRKADVIVQNFTAATAQKLGVDYDSVAAVNPHVVHLTLWASGPHAPEQRGYDLVIQALTGMMAITGEASGNPVKVGVPISDLAAGLYSALAITSQLCNRARSKRGARLDVSLYDSALALLANQSMNWLLAGVETPRMGSEHPTITPYGLYRTLDGAIIIAVGSDAQFEGLARVLSAPGLAVDSRFFKNADRIAHREELRAALEALTTTQSSAELRTRLDAAGIPNAVVRTVGEALDAPDTRTIARIEHAVWGPVAQVMNPIKIDGSYLDPYMAPPELGEHTQEIVSDLDDQ